ncbi:phage protease [Agrobacterium radiobacter]|uniref:phage protease n=1 Tax=Agrobacterium radiobacter TaxID=362 RepID=UPI003F84264A
MKNALATILASALLTAHSAELTASAADDKWMLLIPAGTFSGRDGRGPYHAGDLVSLQRIADTTRRFAGKTDILVDYEHQSRNALENGKPAPAAGWIKEVQARPDGLYGRVEWTANAAAAIKAKEYRYISPVYFHTKEGEVLALHTVALTNVPNLDLFEISAHSVFSTRNTEPEVSMKKVLAALGLSEGGSEDDVLVAINSLLTSSTAIAVAAGLTKDAKSEAIATAVQSVFADRKKIALAAGKKEDASVEDIVSVLSSAHSAGTPDPTKFVPVEQVAAMQVDLKALKEKDANKDAEAAVADAVRDGKLAPALKDWALSMHKADPKKFEEFVGKAPVLTSAQRAQVTAPKTGPAATLDDADVAIMRQLNLTAEDMVKSREAMEASR